MLRVAFIVQGFLVREELLLEFPFFNRLGSLISSSAFPIFFLFFVTPGFFCLGLILVLAIERLELLLLAEDAAVCLFGVCGAHNT